MDIIKIIQLWDDAVLLLKTCLYYIQLIFGKNYNTKTIWTLFIDD